MSETSSSSSSSSSTTKYIDDAIAIETIKLTSNALQGGTWTWAIAGSILFIISIDGAKKMFVKLADKAIDTICGMTASDWQAVGCTVLAPVRAVGRGIALPFRYAIGKFRPSRSAIREDEQTNVGCFEQVFDIEMDAKAWKSIWNHPQLTYQTKIIKVNSVSQFEEWTNIMLRTEEFVMEIQTPMLMEFTAQSSAKKLVDVKVGSLQDAGETLEVIEAVSKLSPDYFASAFTFSLNGSLSCFRSYTAIVAQPCPPNADTYYHYSVDQAKPSDALETKHTFNYWGGLRLYYVPSQFQKLIAYSICLVSDSAQYGIQNIRYKTSNKQVVNIHVTSHTQTSIILYSELDKLSFCKSIKHVMIQMILSLPNKIVSQLSCMNLQYSGRVIFLNFYYLLMILSINCCGTNYEVYQEFCKLQNIVFLSLQITLPSVPITPKKEFIEIVAKIRPYLNHIYEQFDSKLMTEFNIWFKQTLGLKVTPVQQTQFAQVSCKLSYVGNKPATKSEQVGMVTQFIKEQQQKAVMDDQDSVIKINYIKVQVSYTKEKMVNPAFVEFQNRTKQLGLGTESSNSGKAGGKGEESSFFSEKLQVEKDITKLHMLSMTPPEFIYEDKRTSAVEVQELNKSFKRFNTLYLQKQDQSRLLTCLNNFKHHKKLLQDLGYPHKLGVLLYGVPGTGKSATILAIASYLQKDLYYVDLKTIKCNSDLKKVVDHILTINLHGGVIVFEDIDANTNIVHSRDARDASGEGTTTSICGDSDSEFTLDFLLNILQGTLTRDDMVFVITTNYVEKLDAALIRDGRIDVKIEMKLCDNYQLQQMWKTIFKREVHPNVLSKFKTLSFTPASILSRCAQFITVNSMQDEDTEMIDLQILEPFV